jgi:hypothetical protein
MASVVCFVLLVNSFCAYALFAILPQIRGKGSVKPGRGRKDGMPIPGEDEPMHALVTGPDEVRCLGCVTHVSDWFTRRALVKALVYD